MKREQDGHEKVGGYSPIVDEGEFTRHGDIFAAGK